MQDNTEAHKILSKAKYVILGRPELVFFATVMMNLHWRISEEVPTAGTNGTEVIFNPTFLTGLTPAERCFLVLHEIMHVILMHMVRLKERDKQMWNFAGDYVINYYIKHMEGLQSQFVMPKGGLYDARFAGMTTEQVYEILEQENPPPPPNASQLIDLMPPGEQGDSDDSGSGMSVDDQLKQKLDDIIMQANTVHEQSKSRSNGQCLPEEIQIYINSLKSPKLPWNRVLQKFMNEISKVDYSFRKPNRRYFPDYYLPSVSGHGLSRLTVAIDVSGSVSDDELHTFLSEVHSIIASTKPKLIDVMLFHHEIVSVTPVRNVQDLMNVTMQGRGGTCIDPVLEWAEQHKPEGLLIFTDGWIESDYRMLKIPTEWIIYNNNSFKPKFGNVIEYPLDS